MAKKAPRPHSPERDEVVVRAEHLVVRYDEQVVLNDVSMSARRGEVLAILGGSGSGKSTLLRTLVGLKEPVSGRAEVLGVDMTGPDVEARKAIYRDLGIVFQGGALFSSMTVFDNIALPLREHRGLKGKELEIAVRTKLGVVGLAGLGHRFPRQLSGGQRKRVAFARAIAVDPPVLFCDEPSAGLDPRIGRGLDDLILRLCRAFNMAVIVVTHEMESVEVIADRVMMLGARPGGAKVVFDGTFEAMKVCQEAEVRDFVLRRALEEPLAEPEEVLKQLVAED